MQVYVNNLEYMSFKNGHKVVAYIAEAYPTNCAEGYILINISTIEVVEELGASRLLIQKKY